VTDAELEDRVVCPDGRCTGIVGDDGACGTCGARPASGDGVYRAAAAPRDPAPAAAAPGGDEWEDRVPCRDGTCTGVVGPSGRCGTCGKG
jgi:hypothetical protein